MQMSGRATSCLVVLLVTLACASAVQKLRSISDLKKIQFGKSVPKHCLILLHWFANEIEFDNNNVIRLTFDPNSDYGSHHYGNYEGILVPLHRGYRYYTIGNLNHNTTVPLPDYVVHPRQGYDGENRDRIVLSASQQVIYQAFITQHYQTWEQQGTLYDPNHTYQITSALLRQIREFSIRDNNLPLVYLRNRYQSNADIDHLKQTWGNLACLGLFLAIVIKETHTPGRGNNTLPNTPGHLATNTPGHLATNTPGHLATNTPGHLATNTSGHLATNTRGHLATNTRGHLATNTRGHLPTNTRGHLPTNTPKNNRLSSIRSQSTRWEYTNRNDNNTPANCSCSFVCILVFSCIFIILAVVIALLIYFFFLSS